MKKRASLLLMSITAAFSLASCADIFETGKVDDFFTVSFYSDYDGIESDLGAHAPKTEKAKLIGYAYVLKTAGGSVSRPTSYYNYGTDDSKVTLDFKESTRVAPEGSSYKFASWRGYSDNGAAVDMSNINSNCAVFATYDLVKDTFLVKVRDQGKNETYSKVPYMSSLSEAYPDAISVNPTYLNDPYYRHTPFSGWDVYLGDDKTPTATGLTNEEAMNYSIVKDTIFESSFNISAAAYQDYQVRYVTGYYDESSNFVTLSDGLNEYVSYDSPLTLPEETGYAYSYCEGAYSSNSPIEVASKAVDVKHIRYNCDIRLVYKKISEACHVNLYTFDAGSSSYIIGKTLSFEKGSDFTASYTPKVHDNKSFTGKWATDSSLVNPAPNVVDSDLDLYPMETASVLTKEHPTFVVQYRFSLTYGGYLIDGFRRVGGLASYNLTANDFEEGNPLGSGFYVVGVSDINGAFEDNGKASNDQKYIASIELPSSTGFIGLNAMSSMTSLSSIDLQNNTNLKEIGSLAFANCPSLSQVKLPSSLEKMGSCLFLNDTSISSIYVDMTSAEAATKEFSQDWNFNTKLSGITPTYKA